MDARDSGVGTNGLMLNYFQKKKSRYEDEDEDEKELSGVSTEHGQTRGSLHIHTKCAQHAGGLFPMPYYVLS